MPTTISGSSSSGWVDTDSKAGPLSSVHVVIVVINEVEAKMSHFTDLLVRRRPNLPLLQNPIHALLDGGEHVNWLGVIHQSRKKIWTVDGVQQSGGSRMPP